MAGGKQEHSTEEARLWYVCELCDSQCAVFSAFGWRIKLKVVASTVPLLLPALGFRNELG